MRGQPSMSDGDQAHFDLQLGHPLEQIVEAYYSYAITDSMKVSFDYQFIANPA